MSLKTLILVLIFILAGILGFVFGTLYSQSQLDQSIDLSCPEPKVRTSCPQTSINITKRCPEPKCPEPACPQADCPSCDKGFFKRMIESQSRNFIYKEDEYDCTQYANNLAKRLNDKGFDAHSDRIRVDCDDKFWQGSNCEEYNGLHKIVKVDLYIEATTGNVVDPQNYDAYNLN